METFGTGQLVLWRCSKMLGTTTLIQPNSVLLLISLRRSFGNNWIICKVKSVLFLNITNSSPPQRETSIGPEGMINPLTLFPTEQQTVVLLPRTPSASKTYIPIPVDHLEEEFRLRSADDGKLFREEYNVSTPCSPPGGSCVVDGVSCILYRWLR